MSDIDNPSNSPTPETTTTTSEYIPPVNTHHSHHNVPVSLWVLLLLVALLFASLGLLAGNLIWKDNHSSKNINHCVTLSYPQKHCYDYPHRILPYSSSESLGLDKAVPNTGSSESPQSRPPNTFEDRQGNRGSQLERNNSTPQTQTEQTAPSQEESSSPLLDKLRENNR